MDAKIAQHLASEMRALTEPAYLLQEWRDRQSRAYAQRSPGPCGTATHLPQVITSILQLAETATLEDLERAEAVASEICKWMRMSMPSQIRRTGQQVVQGLESVDVGGSSQPRGDATGRAVHPRKCKRRRA